MKMREPMLLVVHITTPAQTSEDGDTRSCYPTITARHVFRNVHDLRATSARIGDELAPEFIDLLLEHKKVVLNPKSVYQLIELDVSLVSVSVDIAARP